MRDESGIQVGSETAVCPFLSDEDGEGIRRCLAKRDDPIQISPRYIDEYCLTAQHEMCSLFLRPAARPQTSAPESELGGGAHRGIVKRTEKPRASHESEPGPAVPVPPEVEREPPVTRPDHTALKSFGVLSEPDAGTLEVENVSVEPKPEERMGLTAPEARSERAIPREEPAPQPASAEAEYESAMAEREPEHEGSIPAPESQSGQVVETMVAKAQSVALEVPSETTASQEQHESTPPMVPAPVITSPVYGAAIRAQDLVLFGTGGRGLTVQLLHWGVTVAEAAVQTDGMWSISLPQTDEGHHIYAARAIDEIGRTSAQSKLLTLTVVPPGPAKPVRFEQAKPSPRERSRFKVVPSLTLGTAAPGVPVLSISWKVSAAVAAVIVLAGLGFFISHSRSQPSAGPGAPPVIVAPAPGFSWSFPPAPAGAEDEILTFANPATAPIDASIHAGGALVRSLHVPPRSGTEVALAPTLFGLTINVNAAGPIVPGSIVTVHGSVLFAHGRTVSAPRGTGTP